MKRCIILLFMCMAFIFAGCQMLSVPMGLVQELLPIAIKYAPYALMFIEAPEQYNSCKENENTIDYSLLDTDKIMESQPADLKPIIPTFLSSISENRRLKAIIAIDLTSKQDKERLNILLSELNRIGKTRYVIVNASDISERQTRRQFADALTVVGIPFYATGPLSQFQFAVALDSPEGRALSNWISNH